MRPEQHTTTESGDLFRARLDQIINLKHELVQLAGKIDREWIDGEIASLYSDQGRPGIAMRPRVTNFACSPRNATAAASTMKPKAGWN
jgi:hypothetical protein